MNSFYYGALSMAVLALSSVGLGGCGAAEEGEGEQVESGEQAFSSQSCSTTFANRTFTGFAPGTFSPHSYNNCTKSYVFDIFNYDPAFTGPGEAGPAKLAVFRGEDLPTTQAACEDVSLHAIFYKRVNGAWVDQTGHIALNGVWGGFNVGCTLGEIDYFDLVPGASYRVAATSRVDSTGATRAVGIESVKPAIVR